MVSTVYLVFVFGGRRRPPSVLLLLRVLVALLRVGRVLFAASAVSHGTRRVQIRDPPESKVLELLQEILATL